jgi:hypothetical protein
VGGVEALGEEDFDAAGGDGRVGLGAEAGAGGVEARGENPGVVEDEEVAGVEELWEVGEEVVGEGAGAAVEGEHAAGATDLGRVLRDEVLGEVVVEVGNKHA